MIVANHDRQCRIDPALEAWIHEESAAMATNILDRLPSAVRQAMNTLDAMEAGTQALMMAHRPPDCGSTHGAAGIRGGRGVSGMWSTAAASRCAPSAHPLRNFWALRLVPALWGMSARAWQCRTPGSSFKAGSQAGLAPIGRDRLPSRDRDAV